MVLHSGVSAFAVHGLVRVHGSHHQTSHGPRSSKRRRQGKGDQQKDAEPLSI